MSRNWEEIGLAWEEDTVSEQVGDNATSRRQLNVVAQLPVFQNIDKCTAAGIDILAWVNSANSPRVRSQAIARTVAKKGLPKDRESLRERVFQALLGVRMSSGGKVVEKEVRVYVLPNGTEYKGTDEMEYRQEFMAALVDLGVENEKAQQMALAAAW